MSMNWPKLGPNPSDARAATLRRIGRGMMRKAQRRPKLVVFPEGQHEKTIRACHILLQYKIARPILLGNEKIILSHAARLGLDLSGVQIVEPVLSQFRDGYIHELVRLRQRRGITLTEAQTSIHDRNVFGSMMVHMGDADALVSGITQHFPETIRPALQIVRVREGLHRVSICYPMVMRNGDFYFLADTSVNIEPSAGDLVEIALCAAEVARRFEVEPHVALLSFSSFGSTRHPLCEKLRQAVEHLHHADPALIVDGEVMADVAVSPEGLGQTYPFNRLKGRANVLIFPDLNSANIAYKLLATLGEAQTFGPILMGMSKPVHLLPRGAEVEEIVRTAAIAVVDAQENEMPSVDAEMADATALEGGDEIGEVGNEIDPEYYAVPV